MKITEIEIDDSQTGYYWIQIYTSNKREATSLRRQILHDQAIRERLEDEIIQSKKVTAESTIPLEITFQGFLTTKLESILKETKS